MKKINYIYFAFMVVPLFAACSKSISDNPVDNLPPNTFVSIFSENSLNPSVSKQTLNWWGDDPDGILEGFIYTFNPNATNHTQWDTSQIDPDWTFTKETQETFVLSLAGFDTVYTFWVKAVDDEGATDPDGAIQGFNILNTLPIVEFPVNTDVPETTFTVATFVWTASDLDGDDTIAKFQYVLDDTTDDNAWIDLPADQTSILLTADEGLIEGEHVFYMRVFDLAGAKSAAINMPRESSDIWYVKEPNSNFLLIDDYNVADNTDAFYAAMVTSVTGNPVDTWDIKSNASALEPPTAEAFFETVKLFDRVFWYADSDPNLSKAAVSLRQFTELGGKVLMSTTFKEFATNLGDPLDFSPSDSLGQKIARITRNQLVTPTSEFTTLGFPGLQVSSAIIPNVFPVVPKVSSSTIYVLPESNSWPGTPPMATINADRNFVFFGLPLAALDGQNTVEQLFQVLLNDILSE